MTLIIKVILKRTLRKNPRERVNKLKKLDKHIPQERGLRQAHTPRERATSKSKYAQEKERKYAQEKES